MAIDYTMPKLAMAMNEGVINQWLVEEGAYVEKGQELATVETEKVAYDVESPEAGYLHILVAEGETVPCETLIAQFATKGSVYSQVVLGQKEPVVGLLSIGGEDTKGNETTREAFASLSNSGLNFRGNVEGHDLFEGETDVVVCDGFVGNIVLTSPYPLVICVSRVPRSRIIRKSGKMP